MHFNNILSNRKISITYKELAVWLIRLDKYLGNQTAFSEHSKSAIKKFYPYLKDMKHQLIIFYLSGNPNCFKRSVEIARDYCINNFAPDHGVLYITYQLQIK